MNNITFEYLVNIFSKARILPYTEDLNNPEAALIKYHGTGCVLSFLLKTLTNTGVRVYNVIFDI